MDWAENTIHEANRGIITGPKKQIGTHKQEAPHCSKDKPKPFCQPCHPPEPVRVRNVNIPVSFNLSRITENKFLIFRTMIEIILIVEKVAPKSGEVNLFLDAYVINEMDFKMIVHSLSVKGKDVIILHVLR